jgi:hypothetical protein
VISPEVPPRVEYELTPLATTLIPHAIALADWAIENNPAIDALHAEREAAELAGLGPGPALTLFGCFFGVFGVALGLRRLVYFDVALNLVVVLSVVGVARGGSGDGFAVAHCYAFLWCVTVVRDACSAVAALAHASLYERHPER